MISEIGILLGQYAGSQSFESVSSWDLQTIQSSLTLSTTEVHSSFQSACVLTSSGANGSLKYDYGFDNDLYDRWYFDITTHTMVSYFWARVDTAANSGMVTAVLPNDSIPIAHSDTLTRYRLETFITSATDPSIEFKVDSYTGNDFNYYIDDIITSVDVIKFDVDRDFSELTNQNLAEHTTLQGRESSYLWGQSGEWNVPISHSPDIQTSVINNWWRKARNLHYTFNTSDTTNMYVVRITNTTNPFTSLSRPYFDHFNGVLKLQTLHYSLDY